MILILNELQSNLVSFFTLIILILYLFPIVNIACMVCRKDRSAACYLKP